MVLLMVLLPLLWVVTLVIGSILVKDSTTAVSEGIIVSEGEAASLLEGLDYWGSSKIRTIFGR